MDSIDYSTACSFLLGKKLLGPCTVLLSSLSGPEKGKRSSEGKPNQNQNQALFSFLYYFLDTKVSVNEITVFIEINLRFGKQT